MTEEPEEDGPRPHRARGQGTACQKSRAQRLVDTCHWSYIKVSRNHCCVENLILFYKAGGSVKNNTNKKTNHLLLKGS